MRVLVTGAGNPFGEAVVRRLLAGGHVVRLFGVGQDVAGRFEAPEGALQWHPGDLRTLGSIEPVLSEREVLIHAACLDPPGKDRHAHAVKIERGTLGCKYGAERELVDQFIHVSPPIEARDRYRVVQQKARDIALSCRKVTAQVVTAQGEPDDVAKRVMEAMEGASHPGRYPGRETDAVTA